MKHKPATAAQSEKKYCATCGRLISSNHRNFEERKYCSKTCSAPRSKPNGFDREIETCFVELARSKERRSTGIECGEVEDLMRGKFEGQSEQVGVPTDGSDDEEGGVQLENVESGKKHEVPPANAHRQGMEKAAFRERVRRAGRRVIAFGAPVSTDDQSRFECVQQGKATEPSFAKGEWAVRVVE